MIVLEMAAKIFISRSSCMYGSQKLPNVSVCKEPRTYPMLVDGVVSLIAGDNSDGVITEVASKKKNKFFWMRDLATGDWIQEEHFGKIHIAELRVKLLSSRK